MHINLMAGADHTVDIRVQRITLKHLFYLLSDVMTIQSGHVFLPILLDFCRPRPIDDHPNTDGCDSFGRFESRESS
jgi:hypothetical protein